MNYDGPSFYKKSEPSNSEEKHQAPETPLERLKKESERSSQLNEEFLRSQQRKDARPGNYYFRSKPIPKSLQNREGWKKETWDQELVDQLQERLKKEPTDYLLFTDTLIEEEPPKEMEEKQPGQSTDTAEEQPAEMSAEDLRIQQMVAEIESTLDTAALVQKEMKPDLRKPNTGLHRTLSNIITKDQNTSKKKKK